MNSNESNLSHGITKEQHDRITGDHVSSLTQDPPYNHNAGNPADRIAPDHWIESVSNHDREQQARLDIAFQETPEEIALRAGIDQEIKVQQQAKWAKFSELFGEDAKLSINPYREDDIQATYPDGNAVPIDGATFDQIFGQPNNPA